ncbi:hypothetical protein ABEX47_07045 [Paenibacillus ehimensis]|uniref:hypothetical protein n=1 Tax=Paenibacillus ehimensis TaxID=79264 RepID=UPI003D2BF64B
MKLFKAKIYVSALVAGTMLFTSITAPASANFLGNNNATIQSEYKLTENEKSQMDQLIRGLTIIESIPDDVLAQGDEATAQWLKKNYGIQQEGFFGCVGAIGTALLGIAFPAAKITKIKDAIKAAGGVYKVVTVITGSYKAARQLGMGVREAIKIAVQDAFRTASSEVFSLLLSFFGISSIIGECFED